jgi:hypothetical protein
VATSRHKKKVNCQLPYEQFSSMTDSLTFKCQYSLIFLFRSNDRILSDVRLCDKSYICYQSRGRK